MADFQHDNPYASPLGAEEPADTTAAETIGVWRDGDELVMLMARVRPPRACWVTNRTGLVLPSPIISDTRAVAIPLLLLHVPVVGILFSIAAAVYLQIRGLVPSFPTLGYLRFRLWLVRLLVAGLVSVSLMAALVVSALGLVIVDPRLAAVVVPAAVLQTLVYYFRDRVQLGLAGRPDGKGLVRVRGVHPGYLDRLPPFSPEKAAACLGKMTGRP